LNLIARIGKFKKFLGRRVWILLGLSTFAGILLFLVESSFIFVSQLFLFTVGLISREKLIVPDWLPTTLNFSICLLLLFGLSRGLILMLKYYLVGLIGQEFVKEQRKRTIEYGLSFASDISTNEIITIFTERMSQGGIFLSHVSQAILVLTSSGLFFIAGLKMAPFEMVIGVSALALFLYPLKSANRHINLAGDGIANEWNFVSSTLIAGLRNNFFLRVYNLVDSEIKKSIQSLDNYLNHYRSYYKISAIKNSLPNIVGILIVSVITFTSIKYIHTSGILLVSFFYLFIRFSQSMSEASTSFSELTLHKAHFLDIYNLYLLHDKYVKNLKISEKSAVKAERANIESISLKVRNLSFSYPDGPLLFHSLSAAIEQGQTLLIKGHSGVGKSTLLMLILGMIRPSSGDVLINDIDIHNFSRTISQFIGYVGPEPYLVIGTLKDNLLFGHDFPCDVSDQELYSALALVCLNTEQFPLNLAVLEHASLSTGQKQRISIARAILRKPKLLILDEATANLDKDTEESILQNLAPLLARMTNVVISHKSSFDSLASVVLNLEKPVKA
jgi:ABC-type multidrug transport system fused ATPase/permease subunit